MQLNSFIEGSNGTSKNVKVRNFQALIDSNYKHTTVVEQITQQELLKKMVQLNLRIGQQQQIIESSVGNPVFRVQRHLNSNECPRCSKKAHEGNCSVSNPLAEIKEKAMAL